MKCGWQISSMTLDNNYLKVVYIYIIIRNHSSNGVDLRSCMIFIITLHVLACFFGFAREDMQATLQAGFLKS